ncbi:MAG: glycosyltransferase family 2 protein [Sporichthyaceae bacterium]
MSPATKPQVSVIIGTHARSGSIGETLRSLAAQTLPPEQFEILVISNGTLEDPATSAVLDKVIADHPPLQIRRATCIQAGLGRARNVGMAMARGDYVTFVDDDDVVSPAFLAGLLACAGPGVVAIAHLADVHSGDRSPHFGNRISRQLVHAGRTLAPNQLFVATTYSVCKLLPTGAARSVGFDPDLRSGEDLAFYFAFFNAHAMPMRVCPIEAHAVYYRSIAEGTNSRREPSYDNTGRRRLEGFEHLADIEPGSPHQAAARHRLVRAETGHINTFLRAHPEHYPAVRADLARRGLELVPLAKLDAGLPRSVLRAAARLQSRRGAPSATAPRVRANA